MENKYFDRGNEHKWRRHHTYLRSTEDKIEHKDLSHFQRAKLRRREICGSGKSVNQMYCHTSIIFLTEQDMI